MFQYNALNLVNMLKMYSSCPNCGQDYVPEPGFYFGAMYFSYAINVAIMVTFGVAVEVLFSPDNVVITLVSVFTPPFIFAPWNFRISRAIMLYALGGINHSEK